MRIEAALLGKLDEVLKDELLKGAKAVTVGSRDTIDALKQRLRAATMSAFGSQRLANTWQSKVYPTGGRESLGAAALLYSKAPHIVDAFSQAQMVTAKDGKWLAIPSPIAMKMRGSRGQRPTPKIIEERLRIKLRLVYRRGEPSLLVADLRAKTTGKGSGYARPSQKAVREGNTEQVVLFFLIPFVHLRQVFDLQKEYDRAADELVGRIVTVWNRLDSTR